MKRKRAPDWKWSPAETFKPPQVSRGKLSIVIETANAAFDEDCTGELARILHGFAASLQGGMIGTHSITGRCVDVNGNEVGRWYWEVK
jgi:hypothetical protein